MGKQSLTTEQMRRAVSRSLQAAGVDRGVLVLAAVSGGMDSVCLLHLLCSLSREKGFFVAAAHVNHGIRGQTAERDEAFVRSLAQTLGVPFFLRRTQTPAYAKAHGLSEEDAARRLRYAALRDMAREAGAALIATAHHADDQAETALMGLVRGSAAMLRGMREVAQDARGRIVRPMLSLSRADVESYVRQNGLSFVTDETNADVSHLRNNLRSVVIPLIEQTCNPAFVKSAGTLVRRLQKDEDFLQKLARPLIEQCVRVFSCGVRVDESLLPIDEAIFARVAAHVLLMLDVPPSPAAVDALFALFEKQVGRTVQLCGGVRAVRVKGGVKLYRACEAVHECVALAVPGLTRTPWGDFRVTGPVPCEDPVTQSDRQWIAADAFDALAARPPRQGERMRPMGLGGSRLVSDVLCDAGFDRAARRNMCVVTCGDSVIWVPLARADESARVKKRQIAYLIEFAAR